MPDIAAIARDAEAQVRAELEGRGERGVISLGLPTADRECGLLATGEVVVVAGRPGEGKTSFALGVALRAAKRGQRTAIVSLEMPGVDLVRIAAASLSGVPARGLASGFESDRVKYLRALREIQGLSALTILDRDHSFEGLLARLRAEHLRAPIKLIVLDYLQRIEPPRLSREGLREQQIALMTGRLKRLALELQVSVLLLAQINRSAETEGREPRKSDLRESGAIEQDADRVLLIHRPSHDHTDAVQDKDCDAPAVRLIVDKHRSGPTGRFWLRFHRPTQTFTELTR